MKKVGPLFKDGINWKLTGPYSFIFTLLIIIVYLMADSYTEKIIFESAKFRAAEVAEIFNISIEADSSPANLVRATKSIATFEDINNLYVIDPKELTIVVASNNIYSRKKIINLKDNEVKERIDSAMAHKKNSFKRLKSGDFSYVYHFIVKSQNSLSFRKLVLVVDLSNERLTRFIRSNLNVLMFMFMVTVIVSMIVFYIRTKKIIISPLIKFMEVIYKGGKQGVPATYDYDSKDELGWIAKTYNNMIKNEFEQKRQLIEAKEASEAAVIAKGEFLSVMSHEIRTPMNGIIGGCSFLDVTDLDEDQKKYVLMISRSAQQLLLLVNDILDFSKIESSKLNLDHSPLDLAAIIEFVVFIFQKDVDEKNIQLKTVLPEQKKLPYVLGDEFRLKQILLNILSNAVKFTKDGMIEVGIVDVEEKAGALLFTLMIKDSGIGIDNDVIDSLFSSFTQADTSTTRKYGGTGLGLAICKKLTELMGGKIWVESKLGQGATFFVSLELEITNIRPELDNKSIDDSKNEEISSLKVLLVEDTEVNQMIARTILEQRGHSVTTANNGKEAIAAFQSGSYDLILMDCFMPIMDGYEATKEIRQIEKQNVKKPIPIVAVTADVSDENKQKCLKAGMNDFLIKPYEPSSLENKLLILFGKLNSK